MKSGKVWGETLDIETNPFVSFHRAVINHGYCCSRHSHSGRANLFFVESGRVRIRVYQPNGLEDETVLAAGETTTVAAGLDHRFEALADSVVFELYWPTPMVQADIDRRDTGGKMEPPAIVMPHVDGATLKMLRDFVRMEVPIVLHDAGRRGVI